MKDGGTRLDSPKPFKLSDSKNFADMWARDGKTIFFESDRTCRFQIFEQPLESTTAQPVTEGQDDAHNAVLSSDGTWILYWTTAHGQPPTSMRFMRLRTAGGASEEILETPFTPVTGIDCPSHAGTSCLFSKGEQDRIVFYAFDPLQGVGKEIARTPGAPGGTWSISPDGSRIALTIAGGLSIIDLTKGTHRDLTFPARLWSLSWGPDGNALYAAAQSNEYFIARIGLDGRTRVLLNRGRNQWLGYAYPSPDGHYLAFSQQNFDTNAWLLENF